MTETDFFVCDLGVSGHVWLDMASVSGSQSAIFHFDDERSLLAIIGLPRLYYFSLPMPILAYNILHSDFLAYEEFIFARSAPLSFCAELRLRLSSSSS